SYLLLFMGSMLGVVLSANLISLFIFWELTSFTSFLLIGFNHEKEDSRRAARQALLITSGGGLALMAGFIFLEISTGSGYNLIDILDQPNVMANSNLRTATILLIAVGAMSKSAQFPLHFWLPNAMAAPTPVSAYLHSATMVKAGVYLIFRLNPIFEDVAIWHNMLGLTGALTMTLGAFKAFQEDDLKKILAYTTISALGIFFMMIGLGGEAAINAAIVYVMAHALYKGALFLAAGSIDHQTGQRRISQLSDLGKKMPATAATVFLSLASMAGVLPFLGFIGKELLYKAMYKAQGELAMVYLALLFTAGAFFTAVGIDIIYNAFLKKGRMHDKPIKKASLFMSLPPLLLAIIGLVTGIVPGMTIEPLLQWSAADIQGAEPGMELKLWHGFNVVFLLSIATLLAGAGLYVVRRPLRRMQKPYWLTGDYLYDRTISGLEGTATVSTKVLQSGFLRNYIAMVILAFSALMILALSDGGFLSQISPEDLFRGIQIYELVILAFVIIAVVFLFRVRSRLIVTATFGIIGYSIALAYTLFSAPDVAITQFLAETLTLILLILIIHRLPSYTLQKSVARFKYLPVAILFGVIMSLTSFILLNQEKNSALQSYFLEKSITEGKGQNAVNVILVDFRAFDTLGEITVLTVTMIGIIALLSIKPDPSES
ncbi:MAG TPA: hydrogen gas-evolving membrane-bound hydrogenase subunit E, partial [Saprospiraceae bacterium]|nr:hydrogen gas-evolving membrane-bound hydrogenase subunit E [Saprospiraceae bacterium]